MNKISIEIRSKHRGGFLSERINAIPYHVLSWLPKVKAVGRNIGETLLVGAAFITIAVLMVVLLIK